MIDDHYFASMSVNGRSSRFCSLHRGSSVPPGGGRGMGIVLCLSTQLPARGAFAVRTCIESPQGLHLYTVLQAVAPHCVHLANHPVILSCWRGRTPSQSLQGALGSASRVPGLSLLPSPCPFCLRAMKIYPTSYFITSFKSARNLKDIVTTYFPLFITKHQVAIIITQSSAPHPARGILFSLGYPTPLK
ncbi:hypothetical protein BJX61DRAFT_109531 [Aspergillus egyptiacus]|nr:hypothetical protein BJX61DRAFT_109531 [Aspergillus egyptiacus]